jgi:1,4-dihydroxy-2-naphthoate octaprenyltransferase
MKIIKFWFYNSRPHALPQSLLPALLALVLASAGEGFSIWMGLLAVFGVMTGHLGLNLFDDYFDYIKKKSDYRDAMAHEGFRARISKCAYLTDGRTTLKALLGACCVFCGLSLTAGVIIFCFRGVATVYFALAAALLGLFYSAAPLRLSYHGLSEVVIALMFGPLAMTGVFFSACGEITPLILFVSLPVGLLVCNIVYVHSIMDVEPDKKVGKSTLAVLLSTRRKMLAALAVIIFLPYVSMIAAPIIYPETISAWYALVVLTLPMAIYLFIMMEEFTKKSDRQFTPQWYLGPMGDWKRISAGGIEWFMVRWYTARNLLSAFCLIIILVSIFTRL